MIKAVPTGHLHGLSHIPLWVPTFMFTWSPGLHPDPCRCCTDLGCMRDQTRKRSRSENGKTWDNPQENENDINHYMGHGTQELRLLPLQCRSPKLCEQCPECVPAWDPRLRELLLSVGSLRCLHR